MYMCYLHCLNNVRMLLLCLLWSISCNHLFDLCACLYVRIYKHWLTTMFIQSTFLTQGLPFNVGALHVEGTTSQGNCHVLGERMTTFVRLHGLTEGDVTHNGSYATTTDFLAVCVRTSFEIDRVIDSSFGWWQTRSFKYL